MSERTADMACIERYIRDHYQDRTLRALASELGCKYACVQRHFARLKRRDLVDPRERCYQPPWSPGEAERAVFLLGRPGWSMAAVAGNLGRSVAGLKLKLHRLGVKSPLKRATAGTLRAGDVMRVLGLSEHRTVPRWIKAGYLKAYQVPVKPGRNPIYAVYAADLVEFLRTHPGRYEAWRIPAVLDGRENPYRQHAIKTRPPTAGYLSTKQAAAALGMPCERLRRWLGHGRFPGRHLAGLGIHAQEWFLTRAEVEALRERVAVRTGRFFLLPAPEGPPDEQSRNAQAYQPRILRYV